MSDTRSASICCCAGLRATQHASEVWRAKKSEARDQRDRGGPRCRRGNSAHLMPLLLIRGVWRVPLDHWLPLYAETMAFAVPDATSNDMFELAPVSLWVEDYSSLRALFEGWRSEGVTDLREHLDGRPHLVAQAAAAIQVLRVNRRTLELFGAKDFADLVAHLPTVLSGDMYVAHAEELVALWDGRMNFTTRTVNYTLGGDRLDVQL